MDNNSNNNNGFSYTYSAGEQAELRRLREKYLPHATDSVESDMERLHRLDRRASRRAQIAALTVGVLGTLLLGLGMSLIMTELAAVLGLPTAAVLPAGIGIGLLGGVIASLAYPLHQLVLRREMGRSRDEILAIIDTLEGRGK